MRQIIVNAIFSVLNNLESNAAIYHVGLTDTLARIPTGNSWRFHIWQTTDLNMLNEIMTEVKNRWSINLPIEELKLVEPIIENNEVVQRGGARFIYIRVEN